MQVSAMPSALRGLLLVLLLVALGAPSASGLSIAPSKDASLKKPDVVVAASVLGRQAVSGGAVDNPKLPEQGYSGDPVRHKNNETVTDDWGKESRERTATSSAPQEYGPTTAPPTAAPKSHAGPRCSAASLATLLLVGSWALST
mmetsp:Transcript_122806/g.393391  ORF Transcript_122806/g.393391 Transcript_122806/m.393391 type:complete len:144 (+) Transcript_122806:39-470(+)